MEKDKIIDNAETAIMDSITSLQDSDREVIPVSDVPDLFIKIQYIVGKAFSKWVGNAAHILSFCLILLPGNVVRSRLHRFLS